MKNIPLALLHLPLEALLYGGDLRRTHRDQQGVHRGPAGRADYFSMIGE